MTKFRTLAAVALTATALTTVAATGSALAWEGGYGHGRFNHGYGFGRYDRDNSYRNYGYSYRSFGYYGDCSYWHRHWGCQSY
jgi:hypothetical protein